MTGSAPTGTVNFKDGATSIAGCAAVALAGSGNARTATCATAALAAGTHSITAVYSGNAGNLASTSAALSQVVKATSSTVLGSSGTPSAFGANVTFTASVTGVAPTGTINFKDGATSLVGCTAVALAGSGNTRTATCTTSTLTAGTHSMTAAYGGDAGNVASTSSAFSQVVNASAVATSTTVATSLTPSIVGGSVTFTATVTGSAPTGTVNFKDGATSIAGCAAVALAGSGNARTATCATAALAAGTHSITAVYSGNAGNLASTSAALSQVVNPGGGGGVHQCGARGQRRRGDRPRARLGVASGYGLPGAAVNNGDRAGLNWSKRRRLDGRHHCRVPGLGADQLQRPEDDRPGHRLFDAGQLREPGRSAEQR